MREEEWREKVGREDEANTNQVDRQSGLLRGLGTNVPPGRVPPRHQSFHSISSSSSSSSTPPLALSSLFALPSPFLSVLFLSFIHSLFTYVRPLLCLRLYCTAASPDLSTSLHRTRLARFRLQPGGGPVFLD